MQSAIQAAAVPPPSIHSAPRGQEAGAHGQELPYSLAALESCLLLSI